MARRARVICSSDALPEGGDGVRFEVERTGARVSAFAIRFEGAAHAYLNRCAHVGVELDWMPGKFFDSEGLLLICSSHGALYDPATGACLGGPCGGGGLEKLAVEERDGEVLLKE
ncbi:MAG: Rieske 2Fe-2S domain-containing protein [Betaproteobacteria bacterium]|jgi:nitrite reductase/ring-hydroxylating ferredoxin subunit|nr:Rieske 2Fe-2S domain-containing protein [Betaproteobacteria bacterium]